MQMELLNAQAFCRNTDSRYCSKIRKNVQSAERRLHTPVRLPPASGRRMRGGTMDIYAGLRFLALWFLLLMLWWA